MNFRSLILWWAAHRLIAKNRPFIIAVTGSIAKTSTKYLIGQLINAAHPGQVRIGYGNLNSFLGVPLAILGFKIDFYKRNITWQWLPIIIRSIYLGIFGSLPKYLVLEFGADRPNDIGEISKQLKLDIALITLVGPAHLSFYKNIEQIAYEKAKIFSCLKPGGLAIINANDQYKQILTKGVTEKVDEISTPRELIAVNYAKHVARRLRISEETIENSLVQLKLPEGRFSKKLISGRTVLDDSYNASPLSMETALEMLSILPKPRVAILGDMLELGSKELQFHREIGEKAKKSAEMVIGVGTLAKNYHAEHWFPNSIEAAESIFPYLPKGGSILVKGSHGVHMQKIIKALEKNGNL